MVDALDLLLDDRPFIEIISHEMRSGANKLDPRVCA